MTQCFNMKLAYIFKILLFLQVVIPILSNTAFAEKDLKDSRLIAAQYGIDCDNPKINRDVIKSRENLAQILLAAGVSYNKIDEAVAKSRKVFNVRKLRAGKPYSIISDSKNTDEKIYFVYEPNKVDYVVFDLGKNVNVYKDSKTAKIRPRTAEGIIESSLSSAFASRGINHALAGQLSEIYAWTLDFFHLQKGDSFKLIYEEKYIGNKILGTGKILGARITHAQKDYYAFYFKNNGQYYDENGNSLKNAFIKAPVKFVKITSGFSKRRLHPILHQYREHLGIDYSAPRGTPVMSVGDGIIEKRTYNRGAGNYLQIRHNKKYMTQYLHLSRYARGMKVGKKVSQGEVIGYVGTSGMATGPHLDFRFWENGKAVNFLKQDIVTADPVKPSLMDKYNNFIADMKADLDKDKTIRFSAEADNGKNG